MAKPTTEPAKNLARREPVLIGSAVLTLAQTALFVAPAFGVKIPDAVQKTAGPLLTVAGAFGVRSLVKPV